MVVSLLICIVLFMYHFFLGGFVHVLLPSTLVGAYICAARFLPLLSLVIGRLVPIPEHRF